MSLSSIYSLSLTKPLFISALAVVSLGLTLTACGGSDDSGGSDTTSAQVTTSTPDQATVVHVAVTDSDTTQSVEADLFTFEVGVPYHFVVENTGDRSHELMIIEPIEPGTMDMEQMDEMALFVIEEDDLAPGATYEFDFTFPADAAGQPLEFACYLPRHYEAGMHAPITVES